MVCTADNNHFKVSNSKLIRVLTFFRVDKKNTKMTSKVECFATIVNSF